MSNFGCQFHQHCVCFAHFSGPLFDDTSVKMRVVELWKFNSSGEADADVRRIGLARAGETRSVFTGAISRNGSPYVTDEGVGCQK